MAKERAGVERAIGSNTFAAKTFASGMYEKYLGLVNEQKIFFDTFFLYSQENNQTFFNEKIKHPVVDEVQKMRKTLLAYGEDRNVVLDTNPTLWFDKITEKINILKEIDDYVIQDINTRIDTFINEETNRMYIIALGLIFIILITVFFVRFFIGSIHRAL